MVFIGEEWAVERVTGSNYNIVDFKCGRATELHRNRRKQRKQRWTSVSSVLSAVFCSTSLHCKAKAPATVQVEAP
jgi:hypothetical protein